MGRGEGGPADGNMVGSAPPLQAQRRWNGGVKTQEGGTPWEGGCGSLGKQEGGHC